MQHDDDCAHVCNGEVADKPTPRPVEPEWQVLACWNDAVCEEDPDIWHWCDMCCTDGEEER